MTLHEQFLNLENSIRAVLPSADKCEIKVSGQGVHLEVGGTLVSKIRWSQLDKPDLYALALNKMQELYKVTEKPLAFLERSDRVELTYPTYTAILDKNLLLQKR